jgi:magnesium-transporting ATPase (P-type)
VDGDLVASTIASSGRTPEGLSSDTAAARLARDGPNVLPSPATTPAWRHLLAQMGSFFALLLWIASALALLAGLPQLGGAILVVVVINAVFASVQEHRAERAAERLRDLLPRRVLVVRDGVRSEVDARELVVGDRVVLGIGDRVSADLEVTEVHGLRLDTSTLTGESVPLVVEVGEVAAAGTFVTEGEGMGTVTATGAATRLASIAALAHDARRGPSPLAGQLRQVVRTISVVAVSVGTVFFGVMLLLGTPPGDGFIFAVGVTVALVPEGLLPTVTLSLAVAAQRMADRHALVRHLEAVETLGATTFVCTDKTGTLTRNEMTVAEVWTPVGATAVAGAGYGPVGHLASDDPAVVTAVRELATAAVRCSTGTVVEEEGRWVARGDPMEAALHTLAVRAGVPPTRLGDLPAGSVRFPFDPRRRRMSVLVDGSLSVKGAPDAVLPRCAGTADATAVLEDMASRGLRVLAVAGRRLEPGEVPPDAESAERELTLLGLVAIHDPPREHVGEALAACRRAGVRVAMVTGDHPTTAAAIATEVGLAAPGAPVLTGADLPADEQLLGALIDRDGIVVARVAPEDKLRIARALQARGHVVAMTGDGVNDGPALQAADVGVAMGLGGTDVAREAADLVLLDDDFATIVAAIEQGRGTFGNIRRFLTYHLTDNVAELTPFVLWAVSGGRFPLALGVLQILALDIGTDTATAVALGAERPPAHVLDQPPTRGRLLDGTVARRAFGLLGPTEATFAIGAFLVAFLVQGWRPGAPFPGGEVALAASGAAFAAVILGQAANAFACRSSTRTPGSLGWGSNRLLLGAVGLALVLGAAFVLVPPVARMLGHAPPPLAGWFVAAATAPAVLVVDHLDKRRSHRRPSAVTTSEPRRSRPGRPPLVRRRR